MMSPISSGSSNNVLLTRTDVIWVLNTGLVWGGGGVLLIKALHVTTATVLTTEHVRSPVRGIQHD